MERDVHEREPPKALGRLRGEGSVVRSLAQEQLVVAAGCTVIKVTASNLQI